ncbi:hypothetical protein NMY22_g11621 [Coprinellus aureogranulatus]|nr:hypothetical protein NMY22_g11621 [Coprinellus aureogranulatus]
MSKSEKLNERISRIFKQDHPKEELAEEPSNCISINDILPSELLAAIFVFNAERSISAFKDVLAISHTCSRWRDTAIGCPELWRSYALMWSIRSDEFATALLKRCGSLMLDAGWDRAANPHIFTSFDVFDRMVNCEIDNIQRLRSYSIVLSSGFLKLSHMRWKNIPRTQSIQELVLDSGDRFEFHRTTYNRIIDPTSPSLRILRLRSIFFDFSTIRTESLHTFDIALPSHAKPWDTQQWLSFINGCPKLAHLSLNLYALPDGNNSRYTDHQHPPKIGENHFHSSRGLPLPLPCLSAALS